MNIATTNGIVTLNLHHDDEQLKSVSSSRLIEIIQAHVEVPMMVLSLSLLGNNVELVSPFVR